MIFDIKVNDILEFRNGEQAMVYEFNGELMWKKGHDVIPIEQVYDDELEVAFYIYQNKADHDIISVRRPIIPPHLIEENWKHAPVVWTRKEKKNELKPCPFCGGEAEIYCDTQYGGTQYQVRCKSCPAEVGRAWFWNKKDAIKAWNRRKTDEQRAI